MNNAVNTVMALSIRQPWAWLIVRPDLSGQERAAAIRDGLIKDIENRSWATKFRGRFLVHAAKGMTRKEYQEVRSRMWLPAMEELQRGGIVGAVTLVDCIHPDNRTSQWHIPGQYGFKLADSEPMEFRPLTGRLQFFEVTE
jgi:hypothetical protein